MAQLHSGDEARSGGLNCVINQSRGLCEGPGPRMGVKLVTMIYQALLNCLLDLLHFDLTESLDLQKHFARGAMDRLGNGSVLVSLNAIKE